MTENLIPPASLQVLLTLIIMAALNRGAGNDLYHLKARLCLPGKPLLYVVPVVGAIVWYWYRDGLIALSWALAFWLWRTPAWGRWIDLNTLPDDYNRVGQKALWYESAITRLSHGSDIAALWLRSLFILPGMALVDYVTAEKWLTLSTPIIAAALVACYAVPRRLRPGRDTIWLAELATGAVWGALIIIDMGV